MSGKKSNRSKRAILVIIDGCGVGAAPDAARFGDASNCNSLANTAAAVGGLKLPNLEKLGVGNITAVQGVLANQNACGVYGKLEECSEGKDTQTGHWELMGLVNNQAFPLYPQGFPSDVIESFIRETGCKGILCNKPASGTDVLLELGEEHQKTGYPIVYTSGDSVFQIACHIETVPLKTQYQWCQIARDLLQGEHRVGRVIARPFAGEPGNYQRLGGDRRDYSVPPPAPTLLDKFLDAGIGVLGIGKIEDIFDRQGVSHAIHTGSNLQGLQLTLDAVQGKLDLAPLLIPGRQEPDGVGFIFTNLVDTDMLWGHRRNVQGYAQSLEEIDLWLGKIMQSMGDDDLLLISSDHGNDPTAPGTDHTREYVPIIAYSPSFASVDKKRLDIGVRKGFVDVAQSVASWFDIEWTASGKSFLPEAVKAG